MKNLKIYLLSILAILFLFSCEEEKDEVNEAKVLVEYLESADSPLGKDFVNTEMPTIISAEAVKTAMATNEVYIIDIRSAVDYTAGHIENAVNVAASNVLSHVEETDLSGYTKIAVVCYTGQTAGWATTLLRIMGYDNAFSMKWGMSSWHSDFDKWTANTGNARATQFTSTVTSKGAVGNLPELTTGKETGQEILEARVDAVYTEGFDAAKVSSQTVFDNLDNYYIVNYWPADQYANPGHIPGAVQYTPKESMKLSADLKTLPTDKPIAVYCYTGQTSAFLTAYLRVLGYDAKSLLFGTNSMIYDIMSTKGMTIFSDAQVMEYEYVQ
ncbi:rhodanese-like domain-containing protein [Bacteroidota bacterium]